MDRSRRFALALLLALGSLPSPSASSQIASLSRDIEPGRLFSGEGTSSNPSGIRALGDKAVFYATEPTLGTELYASDGTAFGTELLADSAPGERSAGAIVGQSGGLLYWLAARHSGFAAHRLWASDGTSAGTRALTDPNLVITSDNPPVLAGARVFFMARFPETGWGLWVSDGTEAGTVLVEDLDPTEQGYFPRGLTVAGTRVFFTMRKNNGEVELWTSDGTEAGTQVLRTFNDDESVGTLAVAGTELFFIAQVGGREQLWASNGEPAGTRMLLAPTVESPNFAFVEPNGNRMLFLVNDAVHGRELWAADGTPTGTRRLTQLPNHFTFPFNLTTEAPVYIEPLGSSILFIAGGSEDDGYSLWRTDGNPAQTRLLVKICPGCSFRPPSGLTRVGSQIYFVAADATQGEELWVSNGTAAGTRLVADLCSGDCSSNPGFFKPIGDELYFLVDAADGLDRQLYRTNGLPGGTRRLTQFGSFRAFDHPDFERVGDRLFLSVYDDFYGNELWVSDESSVGAHLVTDIARAGFGAEPLALTPLGGQLAFRTCGGVGSIWQSQGTPTTTTTLLDSHSVDCVSTGAAGMIPSGALAYFLGGSFDTDLWRTDGTAAGTLQVTDFASNVSLSFENLLGAVGDDFLFSVQGVLGTEIWKTNGTPESTQEAVGFETEPIGRIQFATPGLGNLFFVAGAGTSELGYEVWVIDGTEAGTQRLAENLDFPGGPASNPRFTELGGQVYFFALEPEHGGISDLALWRTDGTATGTAVVAELVNNPSTMPRDVLVHQGALYFFTHSEEGGGIALWTSDGTPAGTAIVTEIEVEQEPAALVALGSAFYFVLRDDDSRSELWRSDGTAAGTGLLVDLLPDPLRESEPEELTAAGGRLFFAATTDAHGTELWVSDGTTAGTHLLHDLAPGPRSSAPTELTVAGNRLYFSADDGIHGRELWSLDLTADPSTCPPTHHGLCLTGNRFRVEIDWEDFRGNVGRGTPVPLTADTGYFWFFNPANVETIVKVLDGRPINNHFWTFYGALSNVEYTMTVTDAETGLTQRYFNPSRQFASVGDTESFGPNGASLAGFTAPNEALFQSHEPEIDSLFDFSKAGSCAPSSTRLCLNKGRFAVEATWKDFQNRTGVGMAQTLTGDTGYFWFFRDSNVEVVTKVLDGRPVNGKFWVFYGALSNVEYTLTVTDTETGQVKTYFNPSRRFGSVGDTGAF